MHKKKEVGGGPLCLTRKEGQSVYIGNDIKIQVKRLSRSDVRLYFFCDKSTPVLRGEIAEKIWANLDKKEE